MPSHTLTCGFGLRASAWYSSLKKASGSAASPPCAASHTARTSPPAQKALPPSPTMTMQRTLASDVLCSSAGWRARIIGSVSALSALGRASVSHATEPRRSKTTSGVAAEAEPHTWRESTPSRVAVLARAAITQSVPTQRVNFTEAVPPPCPAP
eukprot:scaffold63219_cov47-Phaeocystis_antarctica.AAC.4